MKNKHYKFITTIVLCVISILLSTIIIPEISFFTLTITFVIGIIPFLQHITNYYFDIPIEIRKFKKVIYHNKNFDNLSNIDDIINFFKLDENLKFYKRIFSKVDWFSESNKLRLILEHKKFYELYIYKRKLILIRLNDKQFITAKEYEDRRNKTIIKKDLKIFFKDLVKKSKYPDYIPEEKKIFTITDFLGNFGFM